GLHQKDIILQVAKYGTPIEKQVASDIAAALKGGKDFAEGIRPWLSNIAYQSLRAGEHIGDFQQGLQDALNSIETQNTSSTVLIKALITPFFGMIALFVACAGIAVSIFPMLEKQLPLRQWGGLALFARDLGLFFVSYGAPLLIFIMTSIVVLIIALPHWCNDTRKSIDNVLVFRQYRLIHTAHCLNSLSHQTLAGIGLKASLTHYLDSANPYVTWHIEKMLAHIRRGKSNVGDIFDVGLLNQEEQETLSLLGAIGEPSETLKKSADMHQEQLLYEVALIQKIGKNALKILAAVTFAVCAGGVISLIFTIAAKQTL
ncbi:type II secretion system F family protein, partial [Aliivibrio fischeri]|uniref:hypothetical protein n=1 Tax=Aliivibrio fischeri TaxID=668 RepID=UPI003555890B